MERMVQQHFKEETKMDMTTKLHVEIDERFDDIAKLDPSTKEYSAAVDSVTKLMDRAIEIEKFEASETQNEKQMKEDRKSRLVKNCIDVGSVVLPLAVTIWGAKASFKFEEEGTITTTIGRKFMDKIISFKK
jgi:hypothetical protein